MIERSSRERQAWAARLGISLAALDLFLESEVLDLHIDSFIWTRIFGYSLDSTHSRGGPFDHRFLGQVDIPRAREGGLSGATWVITTNPGRPGRNRERTFLKNLERLKRHLRESDGARHVRTEAEYRAARAEGLHAAFIGVQGANCLDHNPAKVRDLPALDLLRATLIHLTPSRLGQTSTPHISRLGSRGLTRRGAEMVEALNDAKVFVDLAHASKQTFFDAAKVNRADCPLLVTHTGVNGVHECWRNLDDAQIRLIAESGGVVGVIFESGFLSDSPPTVVDVVDHIEHVIRVGGEESVAIGTDYDGAIIPPRDLKSPLQMPRLVDEMLRRGWSEQRIKRVLAENALRVIREYRG